MVRLSPWVLPLLSLLAGCPGSVEPQQPDRLGIPLPDLGERADLDAQGASCTGASISFDGAGALVACGSVAVTISGPSAYSWVMAGVTSKAGTTKWSAGASASCPSACTWIFPKVEVPCEPGPYALSLMRDATNDDPRTGVIVATCTP